MAIDLRIYAAVQDAERMSPRQISHMHGLVMASKRRDLAMQANAMRMACAVGFNGDKEGAFDKFLDRLNGRTIIRRIGHDEDDQPITRNIEDEEEAALAALEAARAIRARNQGS